MGRRIEKLKYISTLRRLEDSRFAVYAEQLDEVFDDSALHNIALTGNRGSGKSSIIHSYDKEKNKEEKYLYISLAEFEDSYDSSADAEPKKNGSGAGVGGTGSGKGDGPEESGSAKISGKKKLSKTDQEQLEKRLEYDLLCQILARCTKEDLRSSSLRAITELRETRRFVFGKYLYLFVTSLIIYSLIFEERTVALLRQLKIPDYWWDYIPDAGFFLAFALLFGCLAYLFSKKPGRFRVEKVSLKTGKVDAEVVPSESEYCLDRFKFELVYILNQIADKIDCVVVIEDMEFIEKYCCMDIMSKLWELNYLVNTHRREQYRREKRSNRLLVCMEWIARSWEKLNDREKQDEAAAKKKHAAAEQPEKIKKNKKNSGLMYKLLRKRRWREPIRFIYAVSDRVMEPDDRTKFFDTIIPVTPALNAKNAVEMLKNAFTGPGNVSGEEPNELLTAMAAAVTDYRTLNDIKTEYVFFRELYEKNHPKDKQKQESDQEKYRRECTLMALAAYKALFPYEYHHAFSREGCGMLTNPTEKTISDRSYDALLINLAGFFFQEGYLDSESLTLVGYSKMTLKQQWTSILTDGSQEEKADLLKRFEGVNANRETEAEMFDRTTKEEKVRRAMQKDQGEEVTRMLAKHIFKGAENAIQEYYERICDDTMSLDAFLNLLICLGAFTDDELSAAIQKVNGGDSLDPLRKKAHEEQLKRFREELWMRLDGKNLKKKVAKDETYRKMLIGEGEELSRCMEVLCLLLGKNSNSIKARLNYGETQEPATAK